MTSPTTPTMREALEAMLDDLDTSRGEGCEVVDVSPEVEAQARAALAADDAARGEMREEFEAWLIVRESGRGYPADLWEAWQASRAAAPQSVEPPQTTEHTVRDANQKEHMDKIEQSMLTQAIEGRERIWTCKLGGKISGLPKGADGPMRRAAQECFARMTGYEAEFCFSGWGGELTESERAVVENRLPQHPTAPTDAEWLEEAMRLAGEWVECVYKLAPDGAAIEALRAHLSTRPLPAPPTKTKEQP